MDPRWLKASAESSALEPKNDESRLDGRDCGLDLRDCSLRADAEFARITPDPVRLSDRVLRGSPDNLDAETEIISCKQPKPMNQIILAKYSA